MTGATADSDPDLSLTHVDASGAARMIDVAGKEVTARRAVATARLRMSPATAALLSSGGLPKGEALPVARLAGILAAKRTSELIPLCHLIALSSVDVDIAVDADEGLVNVTAAAAANDRTGVEMEALVAATIASLTLYDMVKGVERDVVIEAVTLREKTGGASGSWRRA